MYDVTIEKAEYAASSKGNWMLKLQYKDQETGRFIFDQIMDDSTKQVNSFRLGRLCYALSITLKGTSIELRDMPKFITKGKALRVVLGSYKNKTTGEDNQNVDISKTDGYYKPGEAVPGFEDPTPVATPKAGPAPILNVASDDLPESLNTPQSPSISDDDESY